MINYNSLIPLPMMIRPAGLIYSVAGHSNGLYFTDKFIEQVVFAIAGVDKKGCIKYVQVIKLHNTLTPTSLERMQINVGAALRPSQIYLEKIIFFYSINNQFVDFKSD